MIEQALRKLRREREKERKRKLKPDVATVFGRRMRKEERVHVDDDLLNDLAALCEIDLADDQNREAFRSFTEALVEEYQNEQIPMNANEIIADREQRIIEAAEELRRAGKVTDLAEGIHQVMSTTEGARLD